MKLTIEDIARVCHEANRAYCQTLGDTSQVPWDEAPEWQKDSARNGVWAAVTGKAKTPEEQHVMWWNQKHDEGWQYGPVKDPVKKTHPCMVPYDWLPVEQRAKDHLFHAIVVTLAGLAYVTPES